MNEPNDQSGRGVSCGPRFHGCRVAALAVALAAAAGAWADRPPQETSITPERRTGSEWSVSVDEAAATTGCTGGPPSSYERPTNEGSVSTETRRLTRTPAEGRAVSRGRLSLLETRPSVDGATPWYRSAIGSLAVVLVLVGAVFFLVKRFIPGVRASESGLLRVVARVALSPKHSVALVSLGRRFVVVGVSPDRLDALAEIHDVDEVAELTARAGTPAARRADGFDEMLMREIHEPAAGDEREPAPIRSRTLRAREPLVDLLNRLRSLQSK